MKTNLFKKKLKYIIIAVIILAVFSNRGLRSLVKNYLEYRRLEHSQSELKLERIKLEQNLKNVKDGAYIERAARTELAMGRVGELE
ncbi:MAG: septum formation initiator family protein, partial [Elusimicrobiota bacterium]|nr:septum formation initiator family protein [Elusimicrobiota bacterium]